MSAENKTTYWLHRISHEMPIAQHLLKEGYLTIGWHEYMQSNLLDNVRKEGKGGFNEFMTSVNNKSRNRWSLWRFLNFKEGDIVLVPMWDKVIICKVQSKAVRLSDINIANQPFENTWTKKSVQLSTSDGLYDTDSQKKYDLGFAVKVNILKEDQPRIFAKAALVARMKIRPTNADISNLKEEVDAFIEASSPPSLYNKLYVSLSDKIVSSVLEIVHPNLFEKLVRWYMFQAGASDAHIPAKNEPGKEDGADADVIATFEDLKVIFYIQAKNHKKVTNEWAVEQISNYKDPNLTENNEYTYIPWVISSADEFSNDAKELAEKNNVRLINGSEFAKMLMNVGFKNIDDILKY